MPRKGQSKHPEGTRFMHIRMPCDLWDEVLRRKGRGSATDCVVNALWAEFRRRDAEKERIREEARRRADAAIHAPVIDPYPVGLTSDWKDFRDGR